MRTKSLPLAAAAAVAATVAAAAAAAALAGPASAETFKLMTGPQGGSWYPLGGAIQNIVQKGMNGNDVQVLPGGGVANVKGVEAGKADIAFANSVSTVDAIEGRSPFDAKAKNVCNLASFYPQYFQIVALKSSGIDDVRDFKGRALATQPRGNTAEDITRQLLQAAELGYDDLSKVHFVSYSDGVSLMKDNNAAVMTLGTTVPASSIMDLASAADITLIGLSEDMMAKMRKMNPGFTKLTIKAGSYPGQSEAVPAIGYATHLIARCDLPEDTAYAILKNIHASLGDLQAIAKAMAGLTPQQMAEDIGVPMHKGAVRFYKEQGAM
ncbi:TAXI family TRAP transporter solute-binding subunit [Azospirillum sp. ST 5-10]|uniref:TAXI family TRAP transporter solute-binding subunit n=1 Tax=unclassified Azospirillum TaxID=2630922 RepID=UPI003F49B4D3